MKAKEENGTIKIYPNMPTAYGNVLNGYELMEELHEQDGFYDVFVPELLVNEQKGAIYFDENINAFTYPIEQIIIVEPTEQELLEQALNNETQMYLQRTQDGVNTYAKLSAEFRLAKLSGMITEEAYKGIERILIPVRNEVLAGQWISAKQLLEEIGFSLIGEDLYYRLHLILTDYIAINYTS